MYDGGIVVHMNAELSRLPQEKGQVLEALQLSQVALHF
jgi:hypothetical protein